MQSNLYLAPSPGSARADSGRRSLVVSARVEVADGVISLTLRDPEGDVLPPWEAGAHLEVVLPSGLIRHYSLCGDADDRMCYRIAVLDEPSGRGGSREIHAGVDTGSIVLVDGPSNRFALIPADGYLFIAGGIGITPILPMIREAERRGVPWRLLYGGRSLNTMAFVDDLATFPQSLINMVPEDVAGRPDLVAAVSATEAGAKIYACGPPGLLDAVAVACAQQGRSEALHVERFVADASSAASDRTNTAIDVELRRSGVTLKVEPDRSILSAILEVNPNMTYSCEEGICGSCETRVLGGIPDHRDLVLSPEERESNKTMMVCVSRAHSKRLELDL